MKYFGMENLNKIKLLFSIFIITFTFRLCVTEENGFQNCGVKKTNPRYVAGSSEYEHWPWMVSLGFYYNGSWEHKCGATIIHPNYLLTAAHCFGNYNKNWTFRLGDFDLSTDKDDTYVSEKELLNIFIHPSYKSQHAYFDVAVAQVETINFNDAIGPVCLPQQVTEENYYNHRHAHLTGWGSYQPVEEKPSSKLRTGTIEIYPYIHCNKTYAGAGFEKEQAVKDYLPNLFQTYVLCAGDTGDNKGSCKGDSGGPLKIRDLPATEYIQIAIVSGGLEPKFCGQSSFPGVYTRIDHPDILNFINSVISNPNATRLVYSLDSDKRAYFGAVRNILPWGRGTLLYRNGDQYVGNFIEGLKSGHGTMTYHNGLVYDGEWKEGLKNGIGIEKYPLPGLNRYDVYEGQFQNDLRTGRGVFKWDNGDVFDGEWLDGFFHGEGVFTFSTNKTLESYTGQVSHGLITGYGVMKWRDGSVYTGTVLNGQKHGKGVLTFPTSDPREAYDGDFKDDAFSGKGIMKWRTGDIYEGDWLNNKKNGQAVWTYPKSSLIEKYEGEFKDDKKSGHGIYIWRNGEVYDGQWSDGHLTKSNSTNT